MLGISLSLLIDAERETGRGGDPGGGACASLVLRLWYAFIGAYTGCPFVPGAAKPGGVVWALASDDIDGARVLVLDLSFSFDRRIPKMELRRLLFFARVLLDAKVPTVLDVEATAVLEAVGTAGALA